MSAEALSARASLSFQSKKTGVVLLAGAVLAVISIFPNTAAPLGGLSNRISAAARTAFRADPSAALGRIPASFEANQGQTDPRVRFLSRQRNHTMFLTDDGAVIKLTGSKVQPEESASASIAGAAVQMQVVGANTKSKPVGFNKTKEVSNDLTGGTASERQTGIPNFGRVAYRQVLPGTDLFFYGKGGALEYDFVVGPGSDPRAIALQFTGAEGLSIDPKGNLVIDTAAGPLLHHKPFLYQGAGRARKQIPGAFELKGADRVGFSVGAYDRSKPLVIDPTLSYTYTIDNSGVSTAGDESGKAIAVDSSGNAYVTGSTSSSDFPTTAGALDNRCGAGVAGTGNVCGGNVTFNDGISVARLPAFRSASPRFTQNDVGKTIVGSMIAAGTTITQVITATLAILSKNATATSLAATFTIYREPPSQDAFVTKLNATGTTKLYSTYLGGNRYDEGLGIAVDGSGNAYVTGATSSKDDGSTPGNDGFPTTSGAFQAGSKCPAGNAQLVPGVPDTRLTLGATYCGGDVFVTKLSSSGSSLLYSTYLGGTRNEFGTAIAIDPSGNAYVTGGVGNGAKDFPTTAGTLQDNRNCDSCVYPTSFVSKINPSASGIASLVYSTYLGSDSAAPLSSTISQGIAVDGSGNAFVTGQTGVDDYPTTAGGYDTVKERDITFTDGSSTSGSATYTSASAVFTTRDLGHEIVGPNIPSGTSIAAVNSVTSIELSASATATGSGLTFTVRERVGSNSDAFMTKLNSTATSMLYSTLLGGTSDSADGGTAIALDGSGNAYVSGVTSSLDFPTTSGAYDTTCGGCGQDQTFANGVSTSGSATYTSATAGFIFDDIGRNIYGANIPPGTTISSVNSTTSIELSAVATATGFGLSFTISERLPDVPDAFVTKINPAASGNSSLVYSTFLGGVDADEARGIAVDSSGNAFVTGFTGETSSLGSPAGFPTTSTAGSFTAAGTTFVAMTTGTGLTYSVRLAMNRALGIDVDSGNAYVTGSGSDDAYIMKIAP